ncbi:hypothetical protein JCM33374_g1909 [Metschnikowia sp. JCM 33374]|nr:hypothetical protein JCM33374_g1909 [Metschnikowia sp. JCM 33374]
MTIKVNMGGRMRIEDFPWVRRDGGFAEHAIGVVVKRLDITAQVEKMDEGEVSMLKENQLVQVLAKSLTCGNWEKGMNRFRNKILLLGKLGVFAGTSRGLPPKQEHNTNSDENDDNIDDDRFPGGFPQIKHTSILDPILWNSIELYKSSTTSCEERELKRENSTRWLSEYEKIESFLCFKEQTIEVFSGVKKCSPADKKRIGVSEFTDSEWEYSKVLRVILYVFIGRTKGLQGSEYATVYVTIPSVHSLLKKLDDMDTETLRVSHPTISSGLTAAYDKLYA